jgi:glycine cleavage system aminomethyltransferase T
VVDGRPAGRVTSARWSDQLGRAIGMAWVPPELAEDGASLLLKVNGRFERAQVRLRPFFDAEGAHLRS